jgi:hypothetical protein
MNFWSEFRKIWFKFKLWYTANKQEQDILKRQKFRWAEARASVQSNSDYSFFREWLEQEVFSHFETASLKSLKEQGEFAYYLGRAHQAMEIIVQIDQSAEFLQKYQKEIERLKLDKVPKNVITI